MQIDLTTLQNWIAASNQLLNTLVPLIPGQLGVAVKAWLMFLQGLESNPLAQQAFVWLWNNLQNIQSVSDVQKLFECFRVYNTVA